jgi:hypothetical protein
MRYNVILAGRPIVREDIIETMPFIPNTEQTIIFDTDSFPTKDIWYGYLQTREQQKGKNPDPMDWTTVKCKSTDPEINKVRECINQFARFMAGEGRDNCNAVKLITLLEN